MTAARMATSSLCSGGRGGGFFCRHATTTTFTRAKGLRRRDVDAMASSTSSSSSEEEDDKNNNSKAIKKETTTETETIFFTVEVETIVARRAIQWDSLAIGDENLFFFLESRKATVSRIFHFRHFFLKKLLRFLLARLKRGGDPLLKRFDERRTQNHEHGNTSSSLRVFVSRFFHNKRLCF